MNATRIRLGALVEWAIAAGCIALALAAVSLIGSKFGSVRAVMPVIAHEAPAPLIAAPAAIPPGAVSVPMLLLGRGRAVRIGETMSDVEAHLGRAEETSPVSVERAPNGERLTRTYEDRGIHFQLVFEPFEKNAEPRLAAIYR